MITTTCDGCGEKKDGAVSGMARVHITLENRLLLTADVCGEPCATLALKKRVESKEPLKFLEVSR